MAIDVTRSPFYAWLDHESIRGRVHDMLALPVGERLVVMKGLVPELVDDLGLAAFEAFLDEMRVKGRRYEEARAHPGEGGAARVTASERLGGPTPHGEAHLAGTRDPRRPGGRALERRWEAELWNRISDERA
jgi:hypothetical protein